MLNDTPHISAKIYKAGTIVRTACNITREQAPSTGHEAGGLLQLRHQASPTAQSREAPTLPHLLPWYIKPDDRLVLQAAICYFDINRKSRGDWEGASLPPMTLEPPLSQYQL